MNLLPRETILMIENEMIDEAVKKFSDSKEASKYFISSLVTSWKFNSEYFFEDANKYLNFTYQFHYIFKRWESDLIRIKKPSQRLIMARFLMMVYHLNNLLKRGIFSNSDSPAQILHRYNCNRPN